jgi:hypothetical protein
MRHYLFILAALVLTGCPHKTVLRDAEVYRAEVNQYDSWATQQSKYLRGFIEAHCTCEEGAFADSDCSKAADFVLTIEARHAWHLDMSLYNASLLDERPAETPPVIADLVCPLPPAPGDEPSDEANIEAEEPATESAPVPEEEPAPEAVPEVE